MKKQYLTFSQRVEVYNFLKTVGQNNGEFWIYNEGWNDGKVAEKFQYTQGNVVTVRMELGRLNTAPSQPFALKIAKIEERTYRLETEQQGFMRIADKHEKDILKLGAEVDAWQNAVKELERRINSLQLGTKFRVNT